MLQLSPAAGKGYDLDCDAWKEADVSQVSIYNISLSLDLSLSLYTHISIYVYLSIYLSIYLREPGSERVKWGQH